MRERLDDIPLLCNHFIQKVNKKTNKNIIGVAPQVLRSFQQYHWPGNIRQLENVLERAFHFSQTHWIEMEHLPRELNLLQAPVSIPPKIAEPTTVINRKQSINHTEKQVVLQALLACQGNRSKTAELLGISRTTLYQKIKKYHIMEELEVKFSSS